MVPSSQEQYNQLAFYTLAHGDASFIHQHIVDAYAAQTADTLTKPITIVFALAGLYLFLEKSYSGKEVQKAHMEMAKNKHLLPVVALPEKRGDITVADVLAKPPGKERDDMIRSWCVSVWDAYKESRELIIDVTHKMMR